MTSCLRHQHHILNSIWDYKQQTVLNKFSNGTTSSSITSLRFINEVSAALCLTATGTLLPIYFFCYILSSSTD